MKKTIQINDIIFTKIDFRYHFMSKRRMRNDKQKAQTIVDSFYPAWIASNIAGQAPVVRNLITPRGVGYAISERVAYDLDTKKLHISELITMLGYTKTDIGKILQRVRNKRYDLILCGVGGSGSNFLHWAYEMMQWSGKDELFNKMTLYDDDDFDIPNMLRIPFIPKNTDSDIRSSLKVDTIPYKYDKIAMLTLRISRRLENNDLTNIGGRKKYTVIYGAPDIATREMLTASDYSFIAATHRDNTYSLVENPEVDNDLMMETYGKINLAKFFLNHLLMTIDFLTHLGEREHPFGRIDHGGQEENVTLKVSDFNEVTSRVTEKGFFKAGSKRLAVGDEVLRVTQILLPGDQNE